MTTPGSAPCASRAGFSFVELLLATALFSIAAVAVLAQFAMVRRAQVAGERATELQQTTRAGLDRLARELRLAGLGCDPDGNGARPDEAIEAAWAGAIVVRADLDARTVSAADPELQLSTGGPFENVTTGNDEIVAYVLGKPDGSSRESLRFQADVAGVPRDGRTERVAVGSVTLTQDDPPYTLYRVQVLPDSTNTRRSPVIDGVRRLRFSYFDGAGAAIEPPGGADDPETIRLRAAIRRVRIELVGVGRAPDGRRAERPGFDAAGRGTYRLELAVAPRNLGGPAGAGAG